MAYSMTRILLGPASKLLSKGARHQLKNDTTRQMLKVILSGSAINFRQNIPFSSTIHRLRAAKSLEAVKDFRSEHNVTVIGEDIPDPYTDISNSEFPDYIKDFLKEQGFAKPTVIQSQGWPIALAGKNFVGIAQTGTGKTLAYLLPAIMHIKNNKSKKGKGPIALVLAPTRELARQIEQVALDIQKLLYVRCACIYGGANRNHQAKMLESGVDIVIATPGRLNDFLVSNVTNLHRCTYVVLDEADRMLDMGFEPQIRQALEGVPKERQILMFSATWPKEVQFLAKDYLGQFVQVNVGSTELSANHDIKQNMHFCEQNKKLDEFITIMHKIAEEGFGKILVFSNTKRFVDSLAMTLRRNGWPALGIHGDKTQLQRDTMLRRFKEGNVNILVATDVAARGLDVDGVTHVINFDCPNTTEDYIHRIGRTGRSGSAGASHTLLTDENERLARDLIDVLTEAKQEVPKELEDMSRAYSMDRSRTKANKGYRPQNRFGQQDRYGRQDRYGQQDRHGYQDRFGQQDRSGRRSWTSNKQQWGRNQSRDSEEYY